MGEWLEALQYPFIYRALIVGTLVSLCAALLGVVLVLKRFSLIGHGLGEVGFAAMSLAVAFDWPPLMVSMPAVILASFLIMGLGRNEKHMGGDISIGIISTASLSFGVIITAVTKGFNVDVYNYMFGSILAMTDFDVMLSVSLSVVVLLVYGLLFNRLFLISYDEINARASGIHVTAYHFTLSFLTAITVVIGMRMMGTLLISSLIIFPALTARKLAGSFRSMVVTAAIVSVLCFLAGMVLSFYLDLPTGACIVGVNIALLAVVTIARRITR